MRTGEDEREFENSFPERTRSSISAYYPFIVFWSEWVINEFCLPWCLCEDSTLELIIENIQLHHVSLLIEIE